MPGQVRLVVRLAPELHAALKEIAADDDRSLNMQINRALREWLAQRRARAEGAAPRPLEKQEAPTRLDPVVGHEPGRDC